MKKEYIAPDFETMRFRLSSDILGDSRWENSDSEVIDSGSSSYPEEDNFD